MGAISFLCACLTFVGHRGGMGERMAASQERHAAAGFDPMRRLALLFQALEPTVAWQLTSPGHLPLNSMIHYSARPRAAVLLKPSEETSTDLVDVEGPPPTRTLWL
mmetsp:Transcript_57397/g.95463  ORF Transcript_57397/g.95463 Transcript_57397/m.95463 type:complete len:106 (-) Transcript_57397:14-331(-)